MESVKQEVLKLVQDASQALAKANLLACAANPMAGAVPSVVQLRTTAQALTELMRELSKLQGL